MSPMPAHCESRRDSSLALVDASDTVLVNNDVASLSIIGRPYLGNIDECPDPRWTQPLLLDRVQQVRVVPFQGSTLVVLT
jgi:hypothetical protein